jgi:hypothetical protein
MPVVAEFLRFDVNCVLGHQIKPECEIISIGMPVRWEAAGARARLYRIFLLFLRLWFWLWYREVKAIWRLFIFQRLRTSSKSAISPKLLDPNHAPAVNDPAPITTKNTVHFEFFDEPINLIFC